MAPLYDELGHSGDSNFVYTVNVGKSATLANIRSGGRKFYRLKPVKDLIARNQIR